MKNEQSLLRIGIPSGKVLRGSEFREALARSNMLPSEFFHRDSSGSTMISRPSLATVCGKQWVGVLATGKNAINLLDETMGRVVRVASDVVGSSVPVSMESHQISAAYNPIPQAYWIRELVMRLRGPAAMEQGKTDLNGLIKERVMISIHRIVDDLGIDLPSDEALDMRVSQAERPRGLRLQTTTGTTNEFSTLVDVQFLISADLRGIWQVGNLTSRGYGRIGLDRARLASMFDKEEKRPRRILS